MEKTASAVWQGGLKDGNGALSTASGALQSTNYGFSSRFESGTATNPEELIAAAHAGCFSMALSKELQDAGYLPERIETKATVTLAKQADGFAVTRSHLDLTAHVPGADQKRFEEVAAAAKQGCPISKLLKAEITLNARLA